jgi:hypothetical protein
VIVFDLRCGADHIFEAWFGSNADWERQCAAGLVNCPICGDADVRKAVMAPAVPAKANRRPDLPPAFVKKAMAALAAGQAKALENSTWVGDQFATRARAMHAGDEAQRTIHGQTTLADAKALVAEGVPVAPLPLPVTPPKQLN